jgi:glycosyltransferase involved in cell wall biosynthesis
MLSLSAVPIRPEAMDEMRRYTERVIVVEVGGANAPGLARLLARLPGPTRRVAAELSLRHAVGRARHAFQRLVAQETFDVVLFHGKCLTPVIEGFDALPVVVDFCDATSLRILGNLKRAGPAKRLLLAARYGQVLRTERKLLRRSHQLAFVSARDRDTILGKDASKGRVVTIGVDHEFWKRRSSPSSTPVLVFSGIMSYAPNEDAALVLIDRILPRVRRSIPNVELHLIGRDPSPELRSKAAAAEGVTVTGFVEDMRPFLEAGWLTAVPLRYGAGVQNKILEAMAMELPVVTSSLACGGLRVDGGEDPPVEVADDDEEFAERVVKLLEQDGERARLAAAGRHFVEQHYDWARSATRLERLCSKAVAAFGDDSSERTTERWHNQ